MEVDKEIANKRTRKRNEDIKTTRLKRQKINNVIFIIYVS